MNVTQEPEDIHASSIRRAGLALVLGALACVALAAFSLRSRSGAFAPPGFVASRGVLLEAERSGIELSLFPTESGRGERQLGENPLSVPNRTARAPLMSIGEAMDAYLAGTRAPRQSTGTIDYAAVEPGKQP